MTHATTCEHKTVAKYLKYFTDTLNRLKILKIKLGIEAVKTKCYAEHLDRNS